MCRRPWGCSSHARMGGKGKPPARATGPRCRGEYQVFACPIDRRLRRLCARRVGMQHFFFVVVRRRSCVVSGAWSSAALLPAAVLCERVRCAWRAGWRARARCCPVAAAAAAAACVLRLSRRRARVPWRVRARRLRGARAGCHGGVRLASCRSCGRGVVSLCGRCACAPPWSCARDVVDAAAGRRRRGHGRVPFARGACLWRCRLPAWHGSARRGGGVGVALAVDAVSWP